MSTASVKVSVKDLLKKGHSFSELNQNVTLSGWVRSARGSKAVAFVMINDGSCQENLQIVANQDLSNFAKVSKLLTGTSLTISGTVVKSQGQGQGVEIHATQIEIVGEVAADYPLQKKATSLEFLREIAHLRPRTQLFGAIFRIRNALSWATHKFFHEQGFYWIHTPIITASDCEGAGEMFRVTTLDAKNPPLNDKGQVNFKEDYFGSEAHLTVSGQLNVECFCQGLSKVYTFGPTFRAENSNTHRHLSEFWMIEPELAFAGLDDVADLAISYIKFMLLHVLDQCKSELSFLAKDENADLVERLTQVANAPFHRVTYTEAIEILKKAQSTAGGSFEFAPDWGMDLQTEHERYLTEKHFCGPTIVTDYPRGIKAFYMKQNDDGKTVRAMDILVPGLGEIIGGSQREENYDKLLARIKEMGLDEKDYWWYLDLRRFGTVPHAGFGLGFERMVQYVTGTHNIRDVIAFPRSPNNANF